MDAVPPQPRPRDVAGQECGDGRVRLLLGDEQPLVRRGLRALFEAEPAFRVLGEASDGHSLLDLARLHRPDVVLMDADLPGPDVLDVVSALCAGPADRGAGVVLLASEGGPLAGYALGAVRAGVRGFLDKHEASEDIVAGVLAVAEGGVALTPRITGQVLEGLRCTCQSAAGRRPAGELDRLTPRELQIFRLVAQGLTNQQIADELFLSEATVKSHFNRICRKLVLRNRVDAVILAYEIGIVGAVAGRGPAA
ncbi:LuxR C-terminal-related transcriptional regulator [Streptomyces sp. URMC 123]|uniref:LuxR C-terminal-related transcriptional regulator n=1 Tax=Streptomyces sp. URMC 123 TaxID=3423403 RepID=UPI003F1B80D0